MNPTSRMEKRKEWREEAGGRRGICSCYHLYCPCKIKQIGLRIGEERGQVLCLGKGSDSRPQRQLPARSCPASQGCSSFLCHISAGHVPKTNSKSLSYTFSAKKPRYILPWIWGSANGRTVQPFSWCLEHRPALHSPPQGKGPNVPVLTQEACSSCDKLSWRY